VSKTQTVLKAYSQVSVIQEVFWRFRKAREEAACVFALVLVKLGDRPHVQELVEDSATVPPLATIFHSGDIPRESAHA
jgi:hypothetical protein